MLRGVTRGNKQSVSGGPLGPQSPGRVVKTVQRFLHSLRGRGLSQRPDFGFLAAYVFFTFQSGRRVVRVTLLSFLDKWKFPVFALAARLHLQTRVHRCRAVQRALHLLVGALSLRLVQVTFLQRDVVVVALSLLLLVLLVRFPLTRPAHPVLLLQASPRVGEPGRDLREAHFGDDGEHDFLALGRIRVLQVLVQPGLQRPGALSCGHLGDPAGVLGCSRTVWRVESSSTSQERVMVGGGGLQVETGALENRKKER